MDFEAFRLLCEARRSVRYFDASRPVTKEDVLELLAVGHTAPNVENTQPWRFHVVLNQQLKEKLLGACCYGNFVAGASAFIVVTCNKASMPETQEILWNPVELEYSCATAMENILLAATAKGLGSSWVSLHRGQPHEVLSLDRHEVVVGGIMLGHFKKGEEEPGAGHIRKPLADVCTFYE